MSTKTVLIITYSVFSRFTRLDYFCGNPTDFLYGGRGVREILEWGLEGEEASSGGDKIHSLCSCIFSLPRGRCQAEKPRLVRALYRFSAGAHLQASLHGCQQKNDCDCRHNRFSAWRRGQDSPTGFCSLTKFDYQRVTN